MVVGVDNNGCVFIGIPRHTLEKLLAGGRECIPKHVQAGFDVPHFCVYAGETDEAILDRIDLSYPGGTRPTVEDHRT